MALHFYFKVLFNHNFFEVQPLYLLFYIASIIPIFKLIEEMVFVVLLPQQETNVGGIYCVINRNRKKDPVN